MTEAPRPPEYPGDTGGSTPPPPPPPPSPPSVPHQPGYPVTVAFDSPERIARWRPLVQWLLAVPHFLVLFVLSIVAFFVVVLAWFAGVFAGKVPAGLQGFIVMILRYSLRVTAYAYFLRPEYPPFNLATAWTDPGDYPGIRNDVEPAVEGRSRLTIFFRLILIIPHYIVLSILSYAVFVVLVIGFFAVIFTARWPRGLETFTVGYLRWNQRYLAYGGLLTDEYPPFSFD